MKNKFLLFVATLFCLSSVKADEGMWLPALVGKLNIGEMQARGLQLSAEQIYSINNSSLKDAIVALDHGSCTGELISAEGLMLTNHHCGFGEIQAHSSVEHDYLRDGFWAMSRDEELPNPGKTVSFLVRMEDVTEKVMVDVTSDMDAKQRSMKIGSVASKLEKEAVGDTHYEAQVKSFFDGNKYFLFVYETFRDVRLVGAPPKSLGKFGGDTDNWMWPRHTCDFSMFRIYTGPDGKPADYSSENVPLKPRHFLPISLNGTNNGDYAMVMGYPGSTDRYLTSWGVDFTMKGTNTIREQVREEKLRILREYMATSQNANIQYASKYARCSNYWKYSIGQNKGLAALDVIEKKRGLEKRFATWVSEDSDRIAKYGEALTKIESSYTELEDEMAYEYLKEAMLRGPEIYMFAYRTNRLKGALEEGDDEKVTKIVEGLKGTLDLYFKDYDATTDMNLVASLSKIYADNVSSTYSPAFVNEVKSKYKGDFSKFAQKMFDKTIFADKTKMESFLNAPSLKVLSKDPALAAASDIFEVLDVIRVEFEKSEDNLSTGTRLFVEGVLEMDENNKKFYPNANSTMRVTYGEVGDYSPRDGVQYTSFTTMQGIIEKEIPNDLEFHVPARLKNLHQTKEYGQYADADGTLHTCFTTNNDITGGNSGSPVINGRGELIGCAFDGNWEAMSGDIAFEPELQKCICVDIRFVLWVVDIYAGASHLVDEMTIIK